ncbi:hypothetical protein L593_13830 [Salinarchaeum sp. Harcht-Bsk1]|uniref:hypothetical protein n=1 Tax=Salinarchaeum sp. Harcht-Bsk1 TaxID=1333523 RepID=UPI0003422C23|nr:hypothetical protein [Salinarchaeum sp. Harcht-Bsk1]AGN02705.1 hypothetical protein L593_13830 [Salinarchaeum sp. Harcht-Bsk1]
MASGATSSILVLVVSILIGGLAIHVGAAFALASKDYGHAVVTAVLGAFAWAVVNYLFTAVGLSPGLSSFVALVVWVGVIGWRYETGWLRAGLIGAFAWVAAIVALVVLNLLGVGGIGAYGIPGA